MVCSLLRGLDCFRPASLLLYLRQESRQCGPMDRVNTAATHTLEGVVLGTSLTLAKGAGWHFQAYDNLFLELNS
eukprot:2168850-Amphidinium_carterae.1